MFRFALLLSVLLLAGRCGASTILESSSESDTGAGAEGSGTCMIGEVKLFAAHWAPRNWAPCEGQLMPISHWSALFSILGTTYGGDGRTTFALPDLRGRVPRGKGNGPGLAPINPGQKGGAEHYTETIHQNPSHHHMTHFKEINAKKSDCSYAQCPDSVRVLANPSSPYIQGQSSTTLSSYNVGGNQPGASLDPWMGMQYIICLQGLYPSRS
uniref:Phage tail collar domain-containing protein n=1 Tax=Chromera velia CCMP2878 TaxID=1169474 RepID=A0A0G4ICD0_9ALVE|eukprot:Cvel_12989.t1-p1 / transcript=Cvel_12989.t1 / gene=Cvel_12989 / organism=Chromera_velia_CCMP2878 / gene_product=hypothetical protein / transcript_product=hypothetical protein / location=Cvel_scaffold871:5137-6415(-) / protein_length=211 / sequence_SO=supercontig / SO=protein_coding / is_pseudo=false